VYEGDDEGPRDRPEALFFLFLVTPFTIIGRVLDVVVGPRRMRRFYRRIERLGGSTD
jgi:hypothetical protein